MPVNAINSTDPLSVSGNSLPMPTKVLNQQDFLKLLVAQMSAQDPMNPQSNSDFAAQMAQFSALQASQGTQSEVAQLHADQLIMQANALLGRTVTLQTTNGSPASGIVNAVQIDSGTPKLVVNGGLFDLSQVLSILPAQLEP